MQSNRLETFTDGVLAFALTVMVLELEAPELYRHCHILLVNLVFLLAICCGCGHLLYTR